MQVFKKFHLLEKIWMFHNIIMENLWLKFSGEKLDNIV